MNRRSLPGELRRNGVRLIEWPPTTWSGGVSGSVIAA